MKETIEKLIKVKWFQWGLIIFAVVSALIPFIGSMFKSGVDCDSAYYICIAQHIANGYIPYKTIGLGYTPLFIYLMAGLKLLFGIPNGCYWPYLLFHYLLEFGVAYFVSAIAQEFGSSKKVSFFGGWLCFMMIHWLQGNCVLLEVPSLFFGLASSLCVLRYKHRNTWNYLWIGALTTCSFLCKQFGLGFIGLNLYLLLAINKQGWKDICTFILGYSIPIVLCVAYWRADFVPIVFSGYGTKTAVEAGRDVSIMNKLDSVVGNLFYFCYTVCCAVFIGLLYLPKAWKNGHFWRLLFGYCGLFGFSIQFIFAGGLHYMMYMVPFACLIITEMFTIKEPKWLKWIKYIVTVFVIAITMYKVYNNRVFKQYIKNDEQTKQKLFTKEVMQYIKPGDKLWVVHGGLYYLLFTMDVLPPNISTIGYSFGPLGLNEEKAFEQAKDADWVIRFSKDYPYESFFTDSVKHFVEQYTLVSQFGDSTNLLYKNPNHLE